jgi:pilus assembly protein CpaE
VAIPIGERVRVFAADEGSTAIPRHRAGIAHCLALLRQRFNVIVVDVPMPPLPAERQALALARTPSW